MTTISTTRQVADELGIPETHLRSLLRFGKIRPEPGKNASGDFVWFSGDVRRAQKALAAKRRKKVMAVAEG
jgi:hypothetical protein